MDITDNDIPQPRMLTEQESLEMKENLAHEELRYEPCGVHGRLGWMASSTATASAMGMSFSWHQCCLNTGHDSN